MRQAIALSCVCILTGLVGTSFGEGSSTPAGTWKWERNGRDGQTRTATLKLKIEGENLTGVMLGRNDRETEIEEATFKENTIAFRVTRKTPNREMVQSFKGTLEGDTIKGKITFDRQGQQVEREWIAHRESNPTGKWTWEVTGRDGQTWNPTLNLKLEADQLTGSMMPRDDQEIEIREASFKDNEIAFQVTLRFGDREVVAMFTGKLEGDTIKGKVTLDRQGEKMEREWLAKRS